MPVNDMGLPAVFSKIIPQKKEPEKTYLTLAIDLDSVSGALWYLRNRKPEFLRALRRRFEHDTDEERTVAIDEVVSALEERTGKLGVRDVIFGLPAKYLTEDENITSELRLFLKKISKDMQLHPIGYVPMHRAIIHALKQKEGVPPTVILINIAGNNVVLTVYKVGVFIGLKIFPHDDSISVRVEKALSEFEMLEVLPTRILLYGSDTDKLEKSKNDLIKHPWTARANFIHFPKIEILPIDMLVTSVSYAGATELLQSRESSGTIETDELAEDAETHDKNNTDSLINGETDESVKTENTDSKNPIQDDLDTEIADEVLNQELDNSSEEYEEGIGESGDEDMDYSEQTADSEKKSDMQDIEEESNVTFISPEKLGFQKTKETIPEKSIDTKVIEHTVIEKKRERKNNQISISMIRSRITGLLKSIHVPTIKIPNRNGSNIGMFTIGIVVALLCLLIGTYFLFTNVLPKADVSVELVSKSATQSAVLMIDTDTASASSNSVIPGTLIEKTVSGESTVQATGKKKVGDPAKGQITIYNKILTSRMLKKGTKLESKNIAFTLDQDTEVASASESIGSITFGKTSANVTAKEIGSQGNVSIGSEFTFEGISSGVLIARNDVAFSGGTSRDITVVSRADYDAVVASVTKDLISQAKKELESSITGSKKLIDQTVKTTVSDKKFIQELDEESKTVEGTVTIAITGIVYDEQDINKYYSSIFEDSTPDGYQLNRDTLSVVTGKVLIKKDGTISLESNAVAEYFPEITEESIRTIINGKKLDEAKTLLSSQNGISNVQITLSSSPFTNKIPSNSKNVHISIIKQ